MVTDLTREQNEIGVECFDPDLMPLLVVKIGSSLLVRPDGEVNLPWLTRFVVDIAERYNKGQKFVVVSSGSIALGARKLGLPKGGRANLSDAQASASVGQIELSGLWAQLFRNVGMRTGQLLLTLSDFESRRRYLSASETIRRLVELGIVPIINENDSLTTEEVRFGDNDRLSARVAQAAGADGSIILSDIDGLYDRNPKEEGAKHLPVVDELTDEIYSMASSDSGSGMGTGGMAAKLEAARISSLAGIPLAIISGKPNAPLSAWSRGARGTIFWPERNENARKSWIGAVQNASGKMRIDEGAIKAIREGNSLLSAGVTEVEGDFQRGDVIDIVDKDDQIVARGLSDYDADHARQIIGRSSHEIEIILGYSPRSAMVHRDYLVLM